MLLIFLGAFALAVLLVLALLYLVEPSLGHSIQNPAIDIDNPEFDELMARVLKTRVEEFSNFELLVGGDQFYESELETIAAAAHTISIEAFIFHKGKISDRFIKMLIDRAKTGVKVRILVDAIGSFWTRNSYFRDLRASGAQVEWYRPIRWYHLKRLNNRTHRELVIIDGKVAFIGGAGIADHWMGGVKGERQWHDFMCRVTGPIVQSCEAVFAENWLESSGEVITNFIIPAKSDFGGESRGLIVESSPTSARATHSRILFQLLVVSAQKSICINSPYFLPDASARAELVKASKDRGVKIKIVTPGPRNNHPMVRLLSRSYYGELLSAGIEVYEYEPAMIHSKSMVVDEQWSVVGSTNFDSRSFGLNHEVNMVTSNADVAAMLKGQFEATRNESRLITVEDWNRRGWNERMVARISRMIERQE